MRKLLVITVLLLLAACGGRPGVTPPPSLPPDIASGEDAAPTPAVPDAPVEPLPPAQPADPPEAPPLPPAEAEPDPAPVSETLSGEGLGDYAGIPIRAGEAELLPLPAEEFQPVPQPKEAMAEFDAGKVEAELLRLINELRVQAGAEPLGLQDELRLAARIRSSEALTKFSHTRPDGTPYNTAFDEADFLYAGKMHGENLASLRFSEGLLDETQAAQKMFDGLKDSPGHRENMARRDFVQVGVGVSVSYGEGTLYLASGQLFAGL